MGFRVAVFPFLNRFAGMIAYDHSRLRGLNEEHLSSLGKKVAQTTVKILSPPAHELPRKPHDRPFLKLNEEDLKKLEDQLTLSFSSIFKGATWIEPKKFMEEGITLDLIVANTLERSLRVPKLPLEKKDLPFSLSLHITPPAHLNESKRDVARIEGRMKHTEDSPSYDLALVNHVLEVHLDDTKKKPNYSILG